jgi:hypothetical protein
MTIGNRPNSSTQVKHRGRINLQVGGKDAPFGNGIRVPVAEVDVFLLDGDDNDIRLTLLLVVNGCGEVVSANGTEQNRKLSEAQDLRESREEDHERMKMERDARTREEEEERHQKHEQDDFIRHIMMARLQSGASLVMRKKVEETWRTQLDAEFAGRRRTVNVSSSLN